jgi:hypothetical protein
MTLRVREAVKAMFEGAGLQISEEELATLDTVDQPLNQHVAAWGPAFYSLYLSRLLERSLSEHAKTLERLSEANEKNEKAMVRLTCVIVLFTAVQAIQAIIEILKVFGIIQ